jgi:phytoene dehydrogenase-like protein
MRAITVIGGGLGGLVAAITARERGAAVRLIEAHKTLGGRWRSSRGPYIVHEGPHVIYRGGDLWRWLKRRGFGSTASVPLRLASRFTFWHGGNLYRRPPLPLIKVLAARVGAVPVDESYLSWASRRFGEEAARVSAAATGVGIFYWNPGELAANFVWKRLKRVFAVPPAASYRQGSWGAMFADLGDYARARGVSIELGSRVTEVGPGVTIVATELESARRLLTDDSLQWPSGRTALLDLGLAAGGRDAFAVSDLDSGGWLETFSLLDPSLAPDGHALVQMQMPLQPAEGKADGIRRLEAIADAALPSWRERVRFRLESIAAARTGAIDSVGTSWRDRPAIDRGDGVYLAGDCVAAPGLLSEVSFHSAIRAATLATPL